VTKDYKGRRHDAAYLQDRAAISERMGSKELWSVIDHWPLYVGVGNLARFLRIYEIVKEQTSVPGHFAEFGSWRGANLMFMAKALQILDPHGSKSVHCFDNFAGLPKFSDKDADEGGQVGAYRGSLEELETFIELYGFGDTIAIHQGLIEETLPAFLNDDRGATFSLIYFDADLYEPAAAVLSAGHERMVKGGVFVFDEWNSPRWPGEGIAVREFMESHGEFYRPENVAGTRQPSLILRKVR
jgi:hypothetical protein